MVGGDPTILNDCGNQLMTGSITLDHGRADMARRPTMPPAATDRAGVGTGVELAYEQALGAVVRAAAHLQATLSEDGYYLQRGSRDIDTVMNHCQPAGGAGGTGPRAV